MLKRGFALVACVLWTSGCGPGSVHSVSSESPVPTVGRTEDGPLMLQATGPNRTDFIDVSWDEGNGQQEAKAVVSPWYEEVRRWDHVYMRVTTEGGTGKVTCTIKQKGVDLAHDEKPGSHGAECTFPTG